MATVATDCDTAPLGFTVIDVDTDNVPGYWVGVQGGDRPNPDKPLPNERFIRLQNSGSLETISLNETDSAKFQICTGYEKLGNSTLTTYRRSLGQDPSLPVDVWSEWKKIG